MIGGVNVSNSLAVEDRARVTSQVWLLPNSLLDMEEIVDEENNSMKGNEENVWIKGPELPYPIKESQVVVDPTDQGGAILIGGNDGYQSINSILKLRVNLSSIDPGYNLKVFEGQWQELPQALFEGRSNHIALMIPDFLTDCN